MALTLDGLARAPQVRGWVLDLGANIDRDVLYAAWDNNRTLPSPDPLLANQVLFATDGGIHSQVRSLVSETFRNVEYLILVGDDRIIPFARIKDFTVLFPEATYTGGGASSGLTPNGTSVGQAIAANRYLSDDPLASANEIEPEDLDERAFFLPSLAVGRLVESYQDIIGSIASFLSQGGILDLGSVVDVTPHKTQITSYDFLTDSGAMIRDRWRNLLDGPSPSDPLAPIDAALIGQNWDSTQLLQHLCGNGGPTYKILNLNGHATHFEEGTPSGGLAAAQLLNSNACGVGQELDLSGSLVYSVGCHSGLPVAGSSLVSDNPQDLAQTFLDLGVLVYIANTGFGWGLLEGVGLSERMVLLFTEQITGGVAVEAGKALLQSKQRYFYESPRFDAYDLKTSMQWTLFGFPMYQIYAGRASTSQQPITPAATPGPRMPFEGTLVENLGPIQVESRMKKGDNSLAANPPYISILETDFDFSAEGVFVKRQADGTVTTESGCPSTNGCYYSLNGLVERASGESDLPIEPYAVHFSLLSGTSQHGVLWLGGTYQQEDLWQPVFGRLMSNGVPSDGAEGLPRVILMRPQIPGGGVLSQQANCAAADVALNNVVITAGETVWDEATEGYTLHRSYVETSLEYLYYNNTSNGAGNCDRQGPIIPASEHIARVSPAGKQVDFEVEAYDADFDTGERRGVWRVVVVFTDEVVDATGRGAWVPLELAFDPARSKWVGTATLPATADHLIYYVQAVDERGNVGWVVAPSEPLPPSGVPLGIPLPIEVNLGDVPVAGVPVLVPLIPDPTAERRPELEWDGVETAVAYHIQVAADAAFSTLLFDGVIETNSFTPNVDLPEGHIYWRVSSRNMVGSESDFSAADDFIVDITAAVTPRLIPVLPDPTRERRPWLQWSVDDATSTGVRLQIALSYTFDPVLLDTVVVGNTFIPPANLPEGRIFWRVASLDAVGNQSPFSSPDDFEIDITPPPIPNLIPVTPDPIANLRPSLSWSSDPAVMTSHLQVASNSDFSSVVLDIVISASGFTPTTGLPEGPTLYWRVAGRDAVGNASAFSAADEFVIDVTPIAPVTTRVEWISSTQWAVEWGRPGDLEGFLQYEIYWANVPFTDISGMTPKAVIQDPAVTSWSDPSPESENWYAVVAVDQAGNRNKMVEAAHGPGGAPIFMDGFESGDISQWSQTTP